MSPEFITIVLFTCLVGALILGVPLSFAMGGIGSIFMFILWGPNAFQTVVFRALEWSNNIVVLAVPLFIGMGLLLSRSGMGEHMFEMIYRCSGRLRGSLAMGVVGICAMFAAMTGINAVATITMGIVALPVMLDRRYNKDIALGAISGGGTLGILIPPSVMMIVLSLIEGVSIGKLFAGGIIPGFVIAGLFIAYIGIRSYIDPLLCPACDLRFTWKQKIASTVAIIPGVLLIVFCLGGIFFGLATPTEAAAIGAFGALIIVIAYRRFSWELLRNVCFETLKLSCMVIWIIIGAQAFISLYTAVGAADFIIKLVPKLNLPPWTILVAMLVILFFMGMFLDTVGIIMLAGPVFVPIAKYLNFDMVWFGIIFVIDLCIGYLTPPFGWNLFYLKGVAPPEITMDDIMRSSIPFIILMIIGLALVCFIPELATWLPQVMVQ
jgi:tripartite ATP-independent transporter DctM subunit